MKTIEEKRSFNVSPQIVEKSENNYPLEGMGDHHRFFLNCKINSPTF